MLGMQFCSRAKWRGRRERVEEERNGWRTIAGQGAEEEEGEEIWTTHGEEIERAVTRGK